MTPERATRRHLVFMALCGLVGWAALAFCPSLPGITPAPARPLGALPFVLFLLVIVAARGLAFRMLPETLVSLDSAFYIAAVVCLGSVPAGRLVALALTLDALLRLLGFDAGGRRPVERGGAMAHGAPRSTSGRLEHAMFAFYFGGMTGGLIMGIGWLFGVQPPRAPRRASEVEVLWVVFGLGLALLCGHYLIQGVRLVLAGHDVSAYVRRMALPGIVAEASLLPPRRRGVRIYHPERPLGFVLLGATYLLINFVFNRLWHASESLRQRVGELETLNRTAHELTSTLQLHELVEAIARETLAAVPEAEVFALSHKEKASSLSTASTRTAASSSACACAATRGSPAGW